MAENREHESDSDSSHESASDSSDESHSDSEPSPTTPAAAAKKPSKPQQPRPTSSESGSETESDSDSNPKDSPIPTQPKESTNGPRKSRSKPSTADPVTQTKSAAKKRRAAEEKDTDVRDAKKKKAEPQSSGKKSTDTPKKSMIHRVWSEDDEIVILQGMIDYSGEKKDANAFLDFIKKNLKRKDSDKDKLQDKIRKLKKKFENNKIKEEKDGEGMNFSKPHEKKLYELSKSVWGNENVKENDISLRKAPPANKRTVVAEKEEAAKEDKAVAAETECLLLANRVKSMGLTVEERVLTIGAEMFENGKGGAGEKEWKKLRLEEMQLKLRLLEVKTAQARLVVDSLMSEG